MGEKNLNQVKVIERAAVSAIALSLAQMAIIGNVARNRSGGPFLAVVVVPRRCAVE